MTDDSEKTYRIGEVAKILKLNSSVLRFWEGEFVELDPLRTEHGQRLYKENHVELLRRIQHLLHEQGMTIEGAKRILAGSMAPERNYPESQVSCQYNDSLRLITDELNEIRKLLANGECQ